MMRIASLTLIVLAASSSLAEASYSLTIKNPTPSQNYVTGSTMTAAGSFTYSWYGDTAPYATLVRVSDDAMNTTFEGYASKFTASYGSGSFEQSFTCPAPPSGGVFAALVDSNYDRLLGGNNYVEFNIVNSPTNGG